MASGHPGELPPCDLVMKGGVTSGVVYPGAAIELAKRYRFQNLGGTSAGAVAAAACAAAEYARQRSGSTELRGLEEVVASFEQPGFFLSLFQPTPEARPLFDLLLRLERARGSRRRQSAALARSAVAYRPWPATLAGIVAIVALILLLAGFRHLALGLAVVLTVVVAAVLIMLVAWTVAEPLVSLARAVHRSLARHGFGLCTGMPSAPGGPEALSGWLHTSIQRCAGLPADQPLTFRMLRDQGISLQMVTTDLGLARPVTIPFAEEEYLFSPGELAPLFPAPVVEHILRVAGVPPDQRDSRRTWFLPADELPVMVGVRLSSSVPLLLSSLRLYGAHADAGAPTESYMTDGGLTSNFPIHFFDHWLPDHPTFGLDLVSVGVSAGTATGDPEPVFMPHGDEAARLPPAQGIHTLGGFLGHMQDASRNWRDELQAQLPGFRDRVCQIRMGPEEGGFHLDPDRATLELLVGRGHAAGREILRTFDWDRHRLTRYLTLIALLRENFGVLEERLRGYPDWRPDPALAELIRQAASLPAPDGAAGYRPEAAMRIGPRV